MLDREKVALLHELLEKNMAYFKRYHREAERDGLIDEESPAKIQLIVRLLVHLDENELSTVEELAVTIREYLIEIVEKNQPFDLGAFDYIQAYANSLLDFLEQKHVELVYRKVSFTDYAWGEDVDDSFVPVGKWVKTKS